MSKSRRLPIYKDGFAREHRMMRRRIRRSIKLKVKDILSLIDKDIYDIPNPKTIVNDYDWSDYTIDHRTTRKSHFTNEWEKIFIEAAKKLSRK